MLVAQRYACGGCGAVVTETHRGRGRHVGEHPAHEYAQCGCSVTWFGVRAVVESPRADNAA